jgi:hypothetical protein
MFLVDAWALDNTHYGEGREYTGVNSNKTSAVITALR